MKKRIALGVLLVLLGYLLGWPVPIDPVAWTAPKAPGYVGPYAQNGALDHAELLGKDVGVGPEHIAFDTHDHFVVGYRDGRVEQFDLDGKEHKDLANTGGRPLGLIFRGDDLIVCDSIKGLLSIAPSGAITVLATGAGGVPFQFTDGVDVAHDGTLYFTDASDKFDVAHYKLDLMEHRARGRLLALSPGDKEPRVLLRDLQFANGVALAADDSYLLFAETGLFRISKYWLRADKAGQVDIVLDNIEGFPDNLSRGTDNTFWVGLTAPRNTAFDALAPYPFARKIVERLPEATQPQPGRFAHVLGIDGDGHVKVSNTGDGSSAAFVSGAVEHAGWLYLASLTEPQLARIKLAP